MKDDAIAHLSNQLNGFNSTDAGRGEETIVI